VNGDDRARVAGAVGFAWGAALLVSPEKVWRGVARRECSDDERLAARLLGLRHLGQGAAELLAPRQSRRPAALVDTAHAVSMIALAALRREYARVALASADVALALAALSGWRRARP
jgi:hypothetical protein